MNKECLWDLIKSVKKATKIADDKDWQNDCDWEEFALIMSLKTPQSYGSKIQNRIITKLKGEKVKSNLNKGDVLIRSKYYEIKASILTETNNHMNLVQIRPWQSLDGYLCFAFDIREKNHFKIYQYLLRHSQMIDELNKLGQSAHGTKIVTASNQHNEQAIRIACNQSDETFTRWENSYKINVL